MFSLISNLILAVIIPDLVYIPPEVPQIAPQAIEIVEVIEEPIVKKEPTEKQWADCSCVKFVRELEPNLPRGNAWEQDNNSTPIEGGIVLFKDHIGYLAKIWGHVLEVKHRYLHWNGEEYECVTKVDYYGFNDKALKGFADY